MKTAKELLGNDGCGCENTDHVPHLLELVAQRAREEAYELACAHIDTRINCGAVWEADTALKHVRDNIRALPVKP